MGRWSQIGSGFLGITIYKTPYFPFITKMLYHVYGVFKDHREWILL